MKAWYMAEKGEDSPLWIALDGGTEGSVAPVPAAPQVIAHSQRVASTAAFIAFTDRSGRWNVYLIATIYSDVFMWNKS
jgi:hypothetical protein